MRFSSLQPRRRRRRATGNGGHCAAVRADRVLRVRADEGGVRALPGKRGGMDATWDARDVLGPSPGTVSILGLVPRTDGQTRHAGRSGIGSKSQIYGYIGTTIYMDTVTAARRSCCFFAACAGACAPPGPARQRHSPHNPSRLSGSFTEAK
eukprot:1856188-Prymnesium_polylepis.1